MSETPSRTAVSWTAALIEACVTGWPALADGDRLALENSLIDTVGVALAGTRSPVASAARAFAEATGAPGQAGVWGSSACLTPSLAALANGTAAHALDFDDDHSLIHGHPSCVLVPALLAIGQERGLNAGQFFGAYATGVRAMAALSSLLTPVHYQRGWHSTATIGTVGTAIAVGTALGFGTDQLAGAAAIASSFASGLRANFGTMAKPLHAGRAAQSAIEAVLLAERGIDAAPDILGARAGFLALFGAGAPVPVDAGAAGLGAIREAVEGSVSALHIKRFPSCAGSHMAIEAGLAARTQLEPGDEVTGVRIDVTKGALIGVVHDNPGTGLQAKFSLPYTVARTLLSGMPTLAHFDDSAIWDPAVRRLMAGIAVREDTDGPDTSDNLDSRWVDLTVTTARGREIIAHVSARSEATDAEVDAKFLACAEAGGLDAGRAERLRRALRGLAASPDATDVALAPSFPGIWYNDPIPVGSLYQVRPSPANNQPVSARPCPRR